jgi:hypothetical protein
MEHLSLDGAAVVASGASVVAVVVESEPSVDSPTVLET